MSKLAPVVRVNYVVVGLDLDKVLGHHLDKRPAPNGQGSYGVTVTVTDLVYPN
jgi:hypothetical protein